MHGLGISEVESKLTVFKPFFISTTLPYSVKVDEIFTMAVQVFNYMDTAKDVLVTLFNAEQRFVFSDTEKGRVEFPVENTFIFIIKFSCQQITTSELRPSEWQLNRPHQYFSR
jgi:uncharacterized protein YfaS (alpha-2-macroglobulin family)